ncbi:MAG: FdtA/QdtA family cupin domain-containing protein [Candidatus Portnoybacteria bacterium]|nr:FdtA/QdtA family cupin domain-containing protein [Candidatus Portnoybacteria bacterium]
MGKPDIKVKNSGICEIQRIDDLPDGSLFIAEAEKSVPFKIKRVYFINKLANERSIRGRHAHRKLEQIIFCVNGSFTLYLDDGKSTQEILMKEPSLGIRLGPMLWHEMKNFSYDCVILVLASDYFDENDYIRNYEQFLKMTE